jgi:hypothetical protein
MPLLKMILNFLRSFWNHIVRERLVSGLNLTYETIHFDGHVCNCRLRNLLAKGAVASLIGARPWLIFAFHSVSICV